MVRLKIPKRKLRLPTIKWLPLTSILVLGSLIGVLGTWYQNSPSQEAKRELARRNTYLVKAPDSLTRDLSASQLEGTHQVYKIDEPLKAELATMPNGEIPEYFVMRGGVEIDLAKEDIYLSKVKKDGKIDFSLNPGSKPVVPGLYGVVARDPETKFVYYQEEYAWGVFAFNTDFSVYRSGSSAKLTFGVLDDKGRMICDAAVMVAITDPKGNTTYKGTGDGTIRVNEQECSTYGVTSKPDYEADYKVGGEGTYSVKLTALTARGERTFTDSFEVKDNLPVYIQRIAATRIYPVDNYTNTLRIESDNGGEYTVTEKVPAVFGVTSENGEVTPLNGASQLITWKNITIGKGEAVELSYTYDAPDISPYFYRVGKAEVSRDEVVLFSESRTWQIASDEPGSANGARLWTSGFELQSTTSTVEYTTNIGGTSIDTTTKRSGAAALGVTSSGSSAGAEYDFATSNTADGHYVRAYFYVTSLVLNSNVIELYDSGNTVQGSIRMDTTDLKLCNIEDDANCASPVATASNVLNINTWYMIELKADSTTVGSTVLEMKMDGVSLGSGTVNWANGPMTLRVGVLTSSTSGTIIVDDVAINNDATTDATIGNWAGEGKVVHIKPNEDGTGVSWNNGAGTACSNGAADCWDKVNEVTPDDGTGNDYITAPGTCSTASTMDFQLEDSSTASIGSSDIVRLVTGNIRIQKGANQANSGIVVTLVDSANVDAGSAITMTNGTYFTNDDTTTTANPTVTAYNRPGTGTTTVYPWTTTTIDSLQLRLAPAATDCSPIQQVSTAWVQVEYASATGGRLFSSGFELQSITAGMEWTAVTNTPAIDTTTKRSGAASLRATGWTSATAELVSATLTSANADGPYYFRSYFYATTLPAAATENRIMSFRDSGGTDRAYITITDTGTLKLYDEDGQVGSASSALSTSTWYRIEMQFNRNAGTNGTVEGKIDGTSFATSSTRSVSSGVDKIVVGGNLAAAAITAGDWYFDDIAVNTNSGSAQTSYPGAGKIIHLRPNGNGTNTAWTNTYTNIDDPTTPNDATDLISSSTLNQIEEADVDSFTAAPNSISSSAVISLVSAGVRFNSSSTGVSGFKVTMRDSSTGTPIESNEILTNSTTWKTNTDTGPLRYPITAYTVPNATSAWTTANLDVAQVGVRETTDTADTQQVTALWLLVEYDDTYTISGTSNTTGTVKWAKNASVQAESTSISGSAWTLTLSGSLAADDIITVWIDGAADGSESTAITKYASGISVTGMVLNSNVLSVGSNQNTSVTVTDLDQYDCASDEDVMHRVNASTLEVEGQSTCAGSVSNSYTDETIRTLSSNTLTIGGTETLSAHNVLNDGSLTSGGASTYTISGSWDNNSDFNTSTETITFTSTGSETIDSTGASDLDVNSVVFNGSGGAWTLSSALTVNADMRVTAGTVSGTQNVSVSGGDLDCGASCGTINFTGGTTTVTGTGNLGTTALASNWTFSTLTFGGTTTAQGTGTITVSSILSITGTLNAGAKTYALTGSGTPFQNTGTFTSQTSTVSFQGTSATAVNGGTYNNVNFSPASGTPTYTLGQPGVSSTVVAAINTAPLANSERDIVRDSAGDLYTAYPVANEPNMSRSSNGGQSWTPDDLTGGSCVNGSSIAIAIDSTDIIHMVCTDVAGSSAGDLMYATYNASTEAWVGSTAIAINETTFNLDGFDIAVDSANKPHVVYWGNDTGTLTPIVRYTNRVSGSWAATLNVIGSSSPTNAGLAIGSNDIPQISYIKAASATAAAAVGNANNATSFTAQDLDTSVTTNAGSSIATDSSGNTWVSYIDATTSYVTLRQHLSADAWTTWQTAVTNSSAGADPSIAVHSSGVYVVYEKSSNSSIVMDRYSNSSWLGETTLKDDATVTYSNPRIKWALNSDRFTSDQLDYVFEDSTSKLNWGKIDFYGNLMTVNDFELSNSSGTPTVTLDTNDIALDVNGNFTLSKGTYTASASAALTIGGNYSNCASCTFTHSSATVNMDSGSSGKTITTNGDPFYNLIFNNSGGGWTFSDNITIANAWTIAAGTVNGGSATISLTGSGVPFVNQGTFTPATSTVSYEGTSATDVPAITYNNIQFSPASGSPTYTLKKGVAAVTATKVNDASNFGTLNPWGRQTVRTTAGTLYSSLRDPTSGVCEIWKSTDGSSWSLVDGSDDPTCHTNAEVAMAIGSNDTIHIAYVDSSNNLVVKYNTLASDQYGTAETVDTLGFAVLSLDIAVDSNDKPHVIYKNTDAEFSSLDYSNRISGSWSTSIAVINMTGVMPESISLLIDEDNLPIVSYGYQPGASMAAVVEVGDQNNPTTFTAHTVDSVTASGSNLGLSLAVDSSGNTWLAYVDATTNYITLAKRTDGSETSSWTTGWSTATNSNAGTEPSLVATGSNMYVFYEDENDDIKYDRYNGTTWLGETNLETGTYSDVRAKWSYYSNSLGSDLIDYLYSDGTDVYWHSLVLNAGLDTLTANNFTIVNAAGTPSVDANTSDPILDINGNFAVNKGTFTASGTAALTIAGNFTVSTTSTFDHSSATVTLDGTASATLDSGCSDTDACTSQDLYNLTINKTAAGASDDNVTLTSNGIRVTNTLTITDGELVQGALNARIEGASAVSIASAGRWTNISTGDLKLGGTFVNAGTAEFDSANAGECVDVANDIVITSTSAATQRAWSGAGTFELYNLSVTDMTDSSITAYTSTYSNTTWSAGSCGLDISGIVYMDDESTIATTGNGGPCDGSTAIISVRVDGGAASTTTCSATTAEYTISILPIPTAGQTVAVYLTSTEKANAIYLTGATTDAGINLYENRVVVAHTNAGPMTIVDMIDYDNDQNATDMLFDAEDSTPDSLTLESGTELHVLSGDTFTPGGTVNAVNVHIAGTMSMGSNPLNISGDYTNNGTFTAGTSITTFTATTAGKNISGTLTGSSKFYDLVFNGVGGEWTTNAAIETGNDYTVTNGSIVTANNNATVARDFTLANTSGVAYNAGSSTITVTRNYSDVGGKLTVGTSTLTMNGTGAMDITNAFQFYNLNVAYTGFTTTMDASVQTRVTNDMSLNGGTMTGSSSAVEFMIAANNSPLTFNAATTINGSGFNYFTFGTQADSVVSTIGGGNYGSWPIFASYSANNSTHQIGGAVTATHLRVYTGWPTNCSFNTQGNSLTLGSFQLGSGGATVAFNTNLGASAISLTDTGDAFYTENSGGTYPVNLSSSTITTNGNVRFVNGSGSMTITPGTSTVQWTNTSGTATYAPNGQSLYNMVLNGSGGTVSPTAAVDVNNNFTITAGTYDVTASNYNLTVGGNFSNAGTYNSRANTTTFDATDTGNTLSGTMTGSSDFNALTFNGSGGEWTLSNDVATASDLTVTAGTLLGSANVAIVGASFAGNGTVNLSTPGAVTMTGSAVTLGGNTNWSLGSLNIGTGADADDVTGDGTGSITIAGVFTIANKSTYNAAAKAYILTGTGTPFVIDGSFAYDTSTIDYAATGSQNITSTTYYNLDISAASGTPTKTLAGNITVSNNLTNDANNTLDVSATNYTIALAGNYTNNGTFTARNGTVTLTDTGTQTLNGTMTGSSSFYNLTKSGVGGTVQPSAAVRVGNNFTITAGTYDTVSGSNYALTVGGNYSNSGTFTANSATVTFDATDTGNTISGTLNGSSAFYKVVFNGTGGAWTVQNAMIASADATDTFKVSAGTVTLGNGNGDNLEVRGQLLVATTADETATFQTAAVAEGSSITIDINQNNGGSPTTCTNCGITVGASSGSGQGNFKLAKNTVLRLNPRTDQATDIGLIVQSTGYLEVLGAQDYTGTSTGATETTLTDTGKTWATDENNGKHVRMTSGLAEGRVYPITDTTATVLTRATTASASQTMTVSGSGETRTICASADTVITADDQFAGRYVYDQTGTTGLFQIISSINNDAVCPMTEDSFEVIETPGVFTALTTTNTFTIVDGVQSGDTYEVLDFAHITAEAGTACSATANETGKGEGYVQAASGSQTLLRYAEMCNLGRAFSATKAGFYATTVDNSLSNNGLVIDTLYSHGGYMGAYLLSNSGASVSDFTIEDTISNGLTTIGFNRGEATDILAEDATETGLVFNGYGSRITDVSALSSGTSGIEFAAASAVITDVTSLGNATVGLSFTTSADESIYKNVLTGGNTNHGLSMSTSDRNTIINLQSVGNVRGVVPGSSVDLVLMDSTISNNSTADIDPNSTATSIYLYNTTLGSSNPTANVTHASAYIISRKAEGSTGATKIWGDYAIPAENTNTPQTEVVNNFSYAKNLWEKSVTHPGYYGTGTEDTAIDLDLSGTDLSGGPYTYQVVAQAGGNANCATPTQFTVYRNGSSVGTATCGVLFTDTDGGVNVKFKVEGGAIGYAVGDSYTFVAYNADNSTNTAKTVTLMQDGDTITVGSGKTLEAKGVSGNATAFTRGATGGWHMSVAGTIALQNFTMSYLGGTSGAAGLDLQTGATVTTLANGTFNNFQSVGATDTFVTIHGSLIGTGSPSKILSNLTFTQATAEPEYSVTVAGGAPSNGNFWTMYPTTCTGWASCEASDSDTGDGAGAPNQDGYLRFLQADLVSGRVEGGTIRVPGGTVRVE